MNDLNIRDEEFGWMRGQTCDDPLGDFFWNSGLFGGDTGNGSIRKIRNLVERWNVHAGHLRQIEQEIASVSARILPVLINP